MLRCEFAVIIDIQVPYCVLCKVGEVVMSRKSLQVVLMVLVAAAVWTACSETSLARFHGRRYPTGNSPTYPNATPHGGFSSSNSYYSGRSRIADAPPPPPKPAAAAPPKPAASAK